MKSKILGRERIAFLKDDFERGFIKFCRFEATHAGWGEFSSTVEINEDHRQQDGFIHAGVMATLADHTAGYSAFTTVSNDYQILTIEFKINFLRPAFGNRLVCNAKVIREGRQVIVAESEVLDAGRSGEAPVAKAMVTLMAVHKDRLKAGR
jgi:uncharacterized protein (TIGR00369 family)